MIHQHSQLFELKFIFCSSKLAFRFLGGVQIIKEQQTETFTWHLSSHLCFFNPLGNPEVTPSRRSFYRWEERWVSRLLVCPRARGEPRAELEGHWFTWRSARRTVLGSIVLSWLQTRGLNNSNKSVHQDRVCSQHWNLTAYSQVRIWIQLH